MKKFKSVIALILCAAMVFSLAACSGEKEEEKTSDEEIILEDQAGREVRLDKKAEKIVSCYYISTYALLSLGLGDNIVGLEKKADKRPIYKLACPKLLKKPGLGTLKEFDVEAAAALEPDLVIIPVKLEKYLDALEELGINVLMVDPESQSDLEEMLMLIGKACGKESAAKMLIDYYDEKFNMLEEKTEKLERPVVYMGGNSSYLTMAPNDMFQDDLIENAGGKNAGDSIDGDYWTEVSYETILSMNPDYIIIPSGAQYVKQEILSDKNLQGVKAVKNENVYEMPSSFEEWDSPVPSGVLGVLWLASIIHEDIYSFNEFKEDVKYFYETFYGFTPKESLITK